MSISKKPKICLCMIVKNESHIITETLESIYKYIDYYVINDTGSTDNTVQIIKDFFGSKKIPGEVIIHEFRTCTCHGDEYKKYSFFHFGWNRTFSVKACYGKGDYIWVIDADDLVVGDFKLPNVDTDCFYLKIKRDQSTSYYRPQIFKNDPKLNWRYEGALHEYANCDKPNFGKYKIEDNFHILARCMGSRSFDKEKYQNDAKHLEELLKDEPKNDRYTFYCAQSWFDSGNSDNAIKWYKKRIQLGGWFEEVYYSYFRIALAMEIKEESWDKIEEAYLAAYKYCKDRAEPLYKIAVHYMWTNEYQICYKYAKMAEKIPFPKNHLLFVDSQIYIFGIQDVVAVAAYHVGHYHEAYSINKKLLDNNLIPEKQIKRIQDNLRFSETKMMELEKKTCCVYTDYQFVGSNSGLAELLKNITKTHKILLVGERVESTDINDVSICSIKHIKSIGQNINVDHLVLYNSLNYFFDAQLITSKNITLILSNSTFKITTSNNFNIDIDNATYLNEHLNKIGNIVCTSKEIVFDISTKYKISSELLNVIDMRDKNDTYKLLSNTKEKYQANIQTENILNGLVYNPPKYITHMLNNQNIFQPMKQMIVKHYEQVISDFPLLVENYHMMALFHIDTKNYIAALANIEQAQKTSKNKKKNTPYGDSLLMSKALILNKTKKYSDSYTLANDVLKRNLLPESLREKLETVRDSNVDHIKSNFLVQPKTNINKITDALKNKKNINTILAVMTGETFDIFEKTINSFINCCTDSNKIDYWLCIDELLSDNDRKKIKKTYPFLILIPSMNQKNSPSPSHLNLIYNEVTSKKASFLVYICAGNHFIQKRNYIADSLKILNENNDYGQILFNKNYMINHKEKKNGGIIKYTNDGTRYILHLYYDPMSKEYINYMDNSNKTSNIIEWPHFSIKSSIIRVSALEKIGLFVGGSDFEKQYAVEYTAKGYKTAFLDTFSYIGKEIESSVTQDEKMLSVKILSRNETDDQWDEFKKNAINKLTSFARHVPRNILNLDKYEQQIFLGNKFNYDRRIISEIMYYLDLLKNNNSENLMVLRDNIILNEMFSLSFDKLINFIKNNKYDVILLDNLSEHENFKLLSNNNSNLSMINGFIISKDGCQKIINNITRIGNYDDINKIFQNNNLKIHVFTDNFYDIGPGYQFISNIDQSNVLEGYTFYSQMDSRGNDIGYFGEIEIEKLKEICDEKNGVAFNTLGWIKQQIESEEKFIYLPYSHKYNQGLYIKNLI